MPESGAYCLSCGSDRTICLFNPHRELDEEKGYGMLVKRYEGPHGYPVHDVAV